DNLAAFEAAMNIPANNRGINQFATNYTAGVNQVMANYDPSEGWVNQVIFVSDGIPNQQTGSGGHSLADATRTNWNNFVANNDIDVQTIGVAGATVVRLQNVDEADGDNSVVFASDFDDL